MEIDGIWENDGYKWLGVISIYKIRRHYTREIKV